MLKALPLLTILFTTLCFSSLVQADDHDEARALVKAGKIRPLESILKNLRKIAKGNVIEVELEHEKQQLIYEIELVDQQGIVTEYLFDATTGQLLQQKKED